MPSPIAHAVTGYCLGWVSIKLFGNLNLRKPQKKLLLGLSIFSAIAADADFLPQLFTDSSFHRGVSHSIGAGLMTSILLTCAFARRDRSLMYHLTVLSTISYALHLGLDILTTGGRGIPIFWPLSSILITSPLTIFPQVHHSEGLFYSGHIPVLFFETIYSVGLIFIANKFVVCYKKFKVFRKLKSEP